jgi:hypothetical protein
MTFFSSVFSPKNRLRISRVAVLLIFSSAPRLALAAGPDGDAIYQQDSAVSHEASARLSKARALTCAMNVARDAGDA